MPIRRKRQSREQRRYTRSSTKTGIILRRPAHLGAILATVAAAVAVICLALVWGTYLKAKSDAYRESVENGQWTLNEEMAPHHPVSVPDIRAVSMAREGIGLFVDDKYGGVLLRLQEGDALIYPSAVAETAGLTVLDPDASLKQEIARLDAQSLNVTCTFRVTCFDAADTPTRTYVRGLELGILRELAEAGMDDILLLGLPAGTDAQDARASDFLQELKALLSELPNPPAVGVALPPSAFATDDTYEAENRREDEALGIPAGTSPLYAGNVTPARLLRACDYLAMDLRGMSAEEVNTILPHIRYAYVRHALRLLMDQDRQDAVNAALDHGFDRLFEMDS